VPIPGGRSKKTFFISLTGSATLPTEVVMRQDYALRYEGTKVRDEYTPLVKLAALGLAVPRPLLLEAEDSELGPPFILVERLRGTPPGSYFGCARPARAPLPSSPVCSPNFIACRRVSWAFRLELLLRIVCCS